MTLHVLNTPRESGPPKVRRPSQAEIEARRKRKTETALLKKEAREKKNKVPSTQELAELQAKD